MHPAGLANSAGHFQFVDPVGLDPVGLDPAGLDPIGLDPVGSDLVGLVVLPRGPC